MASGVLCTAVLLAWLAAGAAASLAPRPYYDSYDYDYDYTYRQPARYVYRRPLYAHSFSSVYRYPYASQPYLPADYPRYYGRYDGLRDYDYGIYGGYGSYGGYGGYDGYGGYGGYRGYGGYGRYYL
ncbi:prisilkin-39-like [Schistocerca serialis cubense]|uniref:prisilkin-39-like n=1 Tax=Schistocerca serialis cubense TaxID=2023355 RepID=UPI00214ED9E7|nr:prisilkin-39-like [Schistocerca serialis cubense]